MHIWLRNMWGEGYVQPPTWPNMEAVQAAAARHDNSGTRIVTLLANAGNAQQPEVPVAPAAQGSDLVNTLQQLVTHHGDEAVVLALLQVIPAARLMAITEAVCNHAYGPEPLVDGNLGSEAVRQPLPCLFTSSSTHPHVPLWPCPHRSVGKKPHERDRPTPTCTTAASGNG